MSFTSEYFIINNVNSSDIGIGSAKLIRTNAEINRPIFSKNIINEKSSFRDVPTFYRTDKQVIEFDLLISLIEDEFTPERIQEFGKIFGGDKHIPFESCDYLGSMFYVIATSMNLITYGSYLGWLQIHIITSAPYSFTKPIIQTFDCTTATPTVPLTITVDNKSNVMHPKYNEYYYEPELEFDLLGSNTAFKIVNVSNGGEIFEFTNLTALESIYVNNDLKQIVSSTGNYRLSKLTNKKFFRLAYGVNILKVYGSSMLQIRSQFPLYV